MKKKASPRRKTSHQPRTISARGRQSVPVGYGQLLNELKTRVRRAQLKAAVAANRELIHLYWDIGRMIVERQQREGWGQGIIERLAKDVQQAFPGLKGFSRTNIFRMRAFYASYRTTEAIRSQAVTELRAEKERDTGCAAIATGKNPTGCGTIAPAKSPTACGTI